MTNEPVDSPGLMAVKAEGGGKAPGATSNLGRVFSALTRGEALVYPGRAEEGDKSGTKLLPEEGGEVSVGVDLLGQGRDQGVKTLQEEDDRAAVARAETTKSIIMFLSLSLWW